MPQGSDVKLREPGERVGWLARREHERDLLRQQAASHKRERARGRAIEPLCVIDQAEQRPLLGRLGQQAEGRQGDQERVRRRPCAEAERDGQRVALGGGEAFRELEARRAQLVKGRVGELHLLLDTERSDGPEPPSRLDRVVEQRRLADARLSIDHQHAAVPAARRFEEPVEHLALAAPPEQMLSRWRCFAHLVWMKDD